MASGEPSEIEIIKLTQKALVGIVQSHIRVTRPETRDHEIAVTFKQDGNETTAIVEVPFYRPEDGIHPSPEV